MNRISKNPPPPVNRPQATWASGGITVVQKILKKKDASLRNEIMEISRYRYQQDAKPLQIDAVVNLVRGRNTFLLAGTGYGKSRIPELYFRTLPIRERPVVVILNPLDTLGDNQVLEKKDTKFTAINLTKLTFNPKEADKILNGEYNFVYLSPEIFLNSKMWDRIYFSNKFQRRLGLVVVDEAHMVYEWGIIKKTRGRKRSSALGRHEDRGIFRPSYGNLGGHLMTRNNMPILLMSATCRPVAIEAIKKSLKLPDKTLVMLRGELTRPGIRFIRVTMESSLSSCDDLLDLYAPKATTPDEKVVPTIIYSGSRHRTIKVLEVLDKARGSGDAAEDPDSTFARRFHSITGNLGKVDVAEDFGAGKFPIVSATMALGLGQNWSRVRSVIHMGRGDPAAICQMLGRCGRDGRPGVAIMFVEKTRVGGKNQIHQILDGFEQSDDDRMDGLAITPVCLRIAFSLDTKLGYIPMSFKDSGYLKEKAREESEGFPQYLNAYETGAIVAKRKKIKTRTPRPSTKRALADPEDLRLYKKRMRSTVHELYLRYHGENSFWTADQLFPDKKMDLIAHHADNLANVQQLEILIGGETIEGQLDALMELTIGFQRRIIPVPVPKKSAVAIRAEAATKAIAERASLPTQKTATKPRRSNRISLP
ncbi:hypothetical protein MJO28_008684 [Puccinia striiformis f. sp. tritici]|uniref:DNA 3'-5' helicase n=2 Tax=Puccinia striiformis TaxID=27350 RepID=A0A2S4WEL6_9BASI|nr:hypothetical protein MJO28_008684 [Puccinia striiformis f. sp. tritici]POW20225.1 hypothetical protein PSHT_03721 [Puccinia striiformis]